MQTGACSGSRGGRKQTQADVGSRSPQSGRGAGDRPRPLEQWTVPWQKPHDPDPRPCPPMPSARETVSPRQSPPVTPTVSPPGDLIPLDPPPENHSSSGTTGLRDKGHQGPRTLPRCYRRGNKPTRRGGRSWGHTEDERPAQRPGVLPVPLLTGEPLVFCQEPWLCLPTPWAPSVQQVDGHSGGRAPASVTSLCSADLRDEEAVRGRLEPSGASQQPDVSREPTRDRAGRVPVSRCRAGSTTDRVLLARPPAGTAVAPLWRVSKPRAYSNCQ